MSRREVDKAFRKIRGRKEEALREGLRSDLQEGLVSAPDRPKWENKPPEVDYGELESTPDRKRWGMHKKPELKFSLWD